MNKSHRIVWSESRQAYVVAHEAASSRGKPSSTRSAVASAMVMTLAALASAPALATPACPAAVGNLITVGGTAEVDVCTPSAGQSLNVEAGGKISAVESGVVVYGVAAGTITNSGTVSGTDFQGIAIENNSTVTSITNSGTISGFYSGIYTNASTVTSITNSGTISALKGGTGNGITVDAGSSIATITNSGTISGNGAAIVAYTGLTNIFITGNNTANFIGKVEALNTSVTVNSDATYTANPTASSQLFNVKDFTNAGTLKIGSGKTLVIRGKFTNTGTFTPIVTDTGFGKLMVLGTATLGGTLAIDASTLTAGQTNGNTLAGIITATAVTGTFATVTDNSALFDFEPEYTTTLVNLKLVSGSGSGSGS